MFCLRYCFVKYHSLSIMIMYIRNIFNFMLLIMFCSKSCFSTWGFLKLGVPPNHPCYIIGFSIMNHPAIGVPPWLWKPPHIKVRFPISSSTNRGVPYIINIISLWTNNSSRKRPMFSTARPSSLTLGWTQPQWWQLQWRLQEPWTFGPCFFGEMFVDFNILVVSRFHDDKIEKYYIIFLVGYLLKNWSTFTLW